MLVRLLQVLYAPLLRNVSKVAEIRVLLELLSLHLMGHHLVRVLLLLLLGWLVKLLRLHILLNNLLFQFEFKLIS